MSPVLDKRAKAKLAAEAAKGDTGAFSQLYAEIYKQLYYYALMNLSSREDASDAVQDAVLDAFTSISTLKNAAAFEGWMFKILSAKIKQRQREYAEKRQYEGCTEEALQLKGEESGFRKCEILEEFATLNRQERMCMSLYSISGYKAKEIAEIMGMEPSTVRSCISRGRSRLRTGLGLKSEGVI